MPHMTIQYDEDTDELLEDLKKFFGVKTKVAVIRRALAIARAAKRYADSDRTVRISRPRSEEGENFMIGS